MMKPGTILKRLYEQLVPAAKKQQIADFCVGLSYAGVKLNNDATGIAAVMRDEKPINGNLPDAGAIIGARAVDLLQYLVTGKTSRQLALGLAAANALIDPSSDKTEDREATTYLNLQPGEKVAMVGLFAPLTEKILAGGAILTIIEKNPSRAALITPEEKQQALQDCDIAIITATTLLNGTFEETIGFLGKPRSVVLLGPSTPLMSVIFDHTPVTHLGGAIVANPRQVLQLIADGCGTTKLRPYLRFVNLIRK
jgi:uncharacterized protein